MNRGGKGIGLSSGYCIGIGGVRSRGPSPTRPRCGRGHCLPGPRAESPSSNSVAVPISPLRNHRRCSNRICCSRRGSRSTITSTVRDPSEPIRIHWWHIRNQHAKGCILLTSRAAHDECFWKKSKSEEILYGHTVKWSSLQRELETVELTRFLLYRYRHLFFQEISPAGVQSVKTWKQFTTKSYAWSCYNSSLGALV